MVESFVVIFKDEEKGRVTIPKKIIDKEGIKKGDILQITVEKKKLQ